MEKVAVRFVYVLCAFVTGRQIDLSCSSRDQCTYFAHTRNRECPPPILCRRQNLTTYEKWVLKLASTNSDTLVFVCKSSCTIQETLIDRKVACTLAMIPLVKVHLIQLRSTYLVIDHSVSDARFGN